MLERKKEFEEVKIEMRWNGREISMIKVEILREFEGRQMVLGWRWSAISERSVDSPFVCLEDSVCSSQNNQTMNEIYI